MDQSTKSLLNVVLSVLAPVIILDKCSGTGDAFWQLGTTWAMVVALSLPIACGVWSYIENRTVDTITFFGLMGTILTGVVTIYANTGDSSAIRPDTPWWYAAKEGLIALLLCGAVLITARKKNSMLRTFVYSDAIFDIQRIEATAEQQNKTEGYQDILYKGSLMLAGSLLVSAIGNFLLALYFLLPVLDEAPEKQAEAYNYAVSDMTWYGYLVIGVPLMLTLFLVIHYLVRSISNLTGLPKDEVTLK